MKIRKATLADSSILLDWRNDNETRINSKNTDIVTQEEHNNWLLDHINEIHIAEIDEPIGTVRINGNELSWTIAPQKRGMGLGGKMLKLFLSTVTNRPLVAYIKRQNIASQRIAKDAGFNLVENECIQKWETIE